MMFKRYQTAFVAGCLIGLTACGGGSGTADVSQNSEPDTSSLLIGNVLDGYLVGAKVCLDINANWKCDLGEPNTISKEGGKFTLDVSPKKYYDTYTTQVVAEVGLDAFDEGAGKTVRDLGLSEYVLASWGGPKPIITPITTILTASMLSEGVLDLSNRYIDVHLRENGLATQDIDYYDPSAVLSPVERQLAQRTGRVLAAGLAHALSRLKGQAPTVYGSDRAYLGGRAARLVSQALSDTRPTNADEVESEQLERITQSMNVMVINVEQETLAQRGTNVLASSAALNVLNAGLYDVSLFGGSPRGLLLAKASGSPGALINTGYEYRNSQWRIDALNQREGAGGYKALYIDSSVVVDGRTPSYSIAVPGPNLDVGTNGLYEKFSSDTAAPARQLHVIEYDVSGLSYSVLPGLSSVTGVFGTNQKVYKIRRNSMVSEIVFDGIASFFTSLNSFKSSPRTCYGGICWAITRQPIGNLDLGTMAFSTTSSGGSLYLGEGTYVDDEIAGVNMIQMRSVPIAVQNRSTLWSSKDGRLPVFAEFDNRVWIGKHNMHNPNAQVWTTDWLLPKDTLNSILAESSLGLIVD